MLVAYPGCASLRGCVQRGAWLLHSIADVGARELLCFRGGRRSDS